MGDVMMCGGAQATPVESENALKTKKGIEFFLKRELSVYEPVGQMTQVVAGTMHFFKINVGDDPAGPFIFVKAFEPLPCNLNPGEDPFQVQGVEQNKAAGDELAF